jgi:nitrogen fixation protein FixH
MTTTSTSTFRFTGWHFLACMVAFFGVDIAINVGFIVRAVQTFPGEVADDPYEAGVAYDHILAREASEQKLGWKASVGQPVAATKGEAINVRWADKAGQPLSGLKVTAVLRRPATEQANTTIRFTETGPGTYRAVAPVAAGAWDMEVTAADAAGRQRTADRRLVWR